MQRMVDQDGDTVLDFDTGGSYLACRTSLSVSGHLSSTSGISTNGSISASGNISASNLRSHYLTVVTGVTLIGSQAAGYSLSVSTQNIQYYSPL